MSTSTQDFRQITLRCPNCAIEISETIEFFRSSPSVLCSGCGASLNFDASAIDEAIKGAYRGAS